MSTYELEINGAGAEAGAERIVKSFDSIKAAADRMEGGVSAAAKKASGSFAEMTKNARPVSEVAINSLKQLSAVFSTFRAPSDAAVRNTIIFLQGLKSVGALNLGRVSGLAGLLSAISGFRGPSSTAGKNTQSLLSALRLAGSYTASRGLASTLTALSAFRGPSSAAARNVLALLTALNNFRAGPGMAATVRALEKIVVAANAARSSLNSLKGAGPSSVNLKVNSAAANKGLMDLTRNAGFLQTALLRTQTAWNALGGVLAIRAIVNASNEMIKIKAQLEAATGSVQQARVQFNYLRDTANTLGLDLATTAKSYGFFLGSIKGTNVTFKEAQGIFHGFTTASRALQLSTEDLDGVFRALGQMMSKGKIQAEELRGQLGDRLPGAFVRFAVALKMTKPGELDQALKKGTITADKMKKAIIDVAAALDVEFAGSADKMSKTVDAAFNRLKSSFTTASAELGRGGLNEAMIALFDTARKFLTSNTLSMFFSGLGNVLKIVANNIDLITTALGFLAVNATVKWLTGLKFLTTAVTALETAIAGFLAYSAEFAIMAKGMGVLAASTMEAEAAFALLGTTLKANPVWVIAGTILGVVAAIKYFTKGSTDQADAMKALTDKMADADNMADAVIQKQLDLAKATGDTTSEIVKQTKAMNELALAGAVGKIQAYSASLGFHGIRPQVGGQDLTDEQTNIFNRYAIRNGTGFSLRDVSGGLSHPDEAGYKTLLGALGEVKTQMRTDEGTRAFEPLYKQIRAAVDALVAISRTPGNKGLDYEALSHKYLGDYNKEHTGASGISGPPIVSGTQHRTQQQAYEAFKSALEAEGFSFDKDQGYRTYAQQAAIKARHPGTGEAATPGHSAHEFYRALDFPANANRELIAKAAEEAGVTLTKTLVHGAKGNVHLHQEFKSGRTGAGVQDDAVAAEKKAQEAADQWAKKLTGNVDKALEDIGDLRVKAAGAGEVVSKVLGGSFDTLGLAALQAGQNQEKAFEDTFTGAQEKSKGVLTLAAALKDTGDIAKDTDISTFDKAKEAIIGVMTAEQKYNAEKEKSAELAKEIVAIHESNAVQANALAVLQAGGSQQDYNRELEIENRLIGVSADTREAQRKQLEGEIATRDALARSIELTNAQRDLENQKAVNVALAPSYHSGQRQEDIDYMKEMLQFRQEQISLYGPNDPVIQSLINTKAASLNAARGMQELQDQYEKTKQTAADMADAIVGGFRDGMQAGDSFLKIFKDIFNQLTKIIMDFVLYNPMKQWLQQSLTQTLAPGSTAGFGGAGTPSTGITNSYSTGWSAISGFADSIVKGISQNIGAASYSNSSGHKYITDDTGAVMVNPNFSSTSSGGSNLGDFLVTGHRNQNQYTGQSQFASADIPPPSQRTGIFSNFSKVMKASAEQTKAVQNFLKTGKGGGDAAGAAIGTLAQAYGIYKLGNQLGSGIAKALGGGFRTQAVVGGIVGGAGAGYKIGSLFGPMGAAIGAAVGAVAGGVLGLLKKKPLIPSSYGTVVVSDKGIATVGSTGTHGNADPKVGKAAAAAGVALFNNFAATYGGQLSPGNYGTFGSREFDPPGAGNKGVYSYWSSKGINGNGKPMGTQGTDWTFGTDSEVQAFALLKQINLGMIKGLSDTVLTVAKNTKATTMEGLQSDLAIGQAFDEFIKGSFVMSDVAGKVSDLNHTFNVLNAQAKVLGLSEDKLSKARARMMKTMKDDFNYTIHQGILQYTNPAQAAYNDLVKEYHDAVQSAMAVGGDLVAVEDLYGRKRADLVKQWAETANNGLISAAKDLYDQLTASTSSPLNTPTVLKNSGDLYKGLITQFTAGDFTNVDKLSTYAQNYLDAARQMYGSSTDYFDIFKQVTDQLNQYENGQGTPGSTTPATVPDLPTLDSLVAEINAQSLDMIDSMGLVGQAVVEGSTNVVDAINNLAIALGQNIPASTTPTTPSGPTAGGTGVGSTGGTGSGGVSPGGGTGSTTGVTSGTSGTVNGGTANGGIGMPFVFRGMGHFF